MIVKVLEGKGGTDGVWGAVPIIRGWGWGGWRQPEWSVYTPRCTRVPPNTHSSVPAPHAGQGILVKVDQLGRYPHQSVGHPLHP